MITVYSKPDCIYCDKAKKYLNALSIPFTEIDIMTDSKALDFFKSEGHKTTPQIYKDGVLLVKGGYTGLVTADIDKLK